MKARQVPKKSQKSQKGPRKKVMGAHQALFEKLDIQVQIG